MLVAFQRRELELLKRPEFLLAVARVDPGLAEELQAIVSRAGDRPAAANHLGNANRILIAALDAFSAATVDGPDADVARQLSLKLRSALAAAARP